MCPFGVNEPREFDTITYQIMNGPGKSANERIWEMPITYSLCDIPIYGYSCMMNKNMTSYDSQCYGNQPIHQENMSVQ